MPSIARLLEGSPEWFRRLAYRVADGRGLLGRVVDVARFRSTDDNAPILPRPTDSTVRLVIGPANSAGRGYQWARAFERYLPAASAVAMRGIGGTTVFRPT